MPIFLLATALAVLAIIIDPGSLAKHFAHPLIMDGAVRESSVEGATLLRWALVGSAIALAAIIPLTRGLAPVASSAPSFRPTGDARSAGPADRPGRRAWLLLAAAILAGLALRVQRIDESLWYDEIASLQSYVLHGPGAIVGAYFSPANHIAQSLASWASIAATGGVNELTIRLPSLIAAVVWIGSMAWIGHAVGGKRVGMLCAGVAALLPVGVLESVEARGYSMAMASSATAIAATLAACRANGSRSRTWLVLLASASLAMASWSHLVAACLTAAAALVAIAFAARRNTRPTARLFLAVAFAGTALTLVLYAPVIPDILSIRREFRALDGDEPGLLAIEGWHLMLQLGGSWTWWAALPGLLVAMLGVWHSWRHRRERPLLAIAVALPMIATGIMLVAVSAGDSWMYARFALFAMPASVVALAWGLVALRSLRPADTLLPTAVGLVIAGAWMASLSTLPAKQPLREAVAFVAAARAPTDIALGVGLRDDVLTYYGAALGLSITHTGTEGERLRGSLQDPRARWLILLYPASMPPDVLRQIAQSGFIAERVFPGWADWGQGTVIAFHRPMVLTNPLLPK